MLNQKISGVYLPLWAKGHLVEQFRIDFWDISALRYCDSASWACDLCLL